MASWAGTTTELHPYQVVKDGCILVSTNMANSTQGHELIAFPGSTVTLSTASDFVRVPIHKKDGKLIVYAAFTAFTTNDVFYPTMIIKYPQVCSTESTYSAYGGAWMTRRGQDSPGALSTIQSRHKTGYRVIQSTASVTASTAEMFGAVFGPIETAKYAFNLSGTSTTLMDINQSYIQFGVMASTIAPAATPMTHANFAKLTTSKQSTSVQIMALEV